MVCKYKTLLPHASPIEKAIEQERNDKYCRNNPEIIRALNNPDTCPVEFLPWLAYSLSVDVWNDSWPESTKRAVCKNSEELHRLKGTRGGLEKALGVLGVRAEIVEWWEVEPKAERGTMALTLWVSDVLLPSAEVLIGAEMVTDLRRQIHASKRGSIHYELTLAVEMTTGVGIAYSAELASLTGVEADMQINIKTQPAGYAFAFSAESACLTYAEMTL